jgi:uncharacterized protein YjbI with pentapeptide repeats
MRLPRGRTERKVLLQEILFFPAAILAVLIILLVCLGLLTFAWNHIRAQPLLLVPLALILIWKLLKHREARRLRARALILLRGGSEGVRAWNESRTPPLSRVGSLAYYYYFNMRTSSEAIDLRNVDLENAALQGVKLYRADLRNARLSGADLSGSDLASADLRGARLDRANLSRCLLSDANLEGAILVDSNLREASLSSTMLEKADLTGTDLTSLEHGARLFGATLDKAILTGIDLHGERLHNMSFQGADMVGANLTETDLANCDFRGANLSRAQLCRADLRAADLSRAILCGANLQGADLQYARLIETNLEGADLSDTAVYGVAVWATNVTGAKQSDLRITPVGEATITVDSLGIAQFVHMLLSSIDLREVLDTITSRAVLILGRFSADRKPLLDTLRAELRRRRYAPIVFDFERPSNRDLTETVSTLAHLSRFIIADLSDPRSVPKELEAVVPSLAVAVQPIIDSRQQEYAMFHDYWKYDWVLPVYLYEGAEELIASLDRSVLTPLETKTAELEARRRRALDGA